MLEVTRTLNFSVVFWVADFVVGHFPPPHHMQFKCLKKGKDANS